MSAFWNIFVYGRLYLIQFQEKNIHIQILNTSEYLRRKYIQEHNIKLRGKCICTTPFALELRNTWHRFIKIHYKNIVQFCNWLELLSPINKNARGKSLLESWVITFLPNWQLPLIFVRFISDFFCMCPYSTASAHVFLK